MRILKNKKSAFTLVELIAVIVILGLVIMVGFNTIIKSIDASKEKAYQEQVNRIINLSKTYAVNRPENLPDNMESIYITIDSLKDEGLLNKSVIDPRDNSVMNGCIKISSDSNSVFDYEYIEEGLCPDENIVYNITYNLNGGTLAKENPTTYTIKTKTFTLNNPSKTGNYFVGWILDGETESYETVRIYKGSTGNRNYTALWSVLAQTLTINPNGGIYDGSSEIISYNKAVGSNVEIKTPEREGYTFTGWTVEAESGELNEEQNLFTIGTTDATLTANWTPTSYTITYNLNGGTQGSGAVTSYNIETATFGLPTPTRSNYTFGGWYENSGLTGTAVTQIAKGSTGDKTYYAKWTINSYTLTINANGGIYSGNNPGKVSSGSTATIANPTRNGYTFEGWTVSGAGSSMSGTTFTMGVADTTITANWQMNCTDIPLYTYTGEDSGVIDDGDGHWRIKFLTSGTFTLTTSVCESDKIDVFMVGGGSSGGGSGYTQTYKQIEIKPNEPYEIVVGEGGAPGNDGTASTAFGYRAEPGSGCNGGSGCGSNGYTDPGRNGGSNGSNGMYGTYSGGTGQGRTTREFGETVGTLYAGGGGGGTGWCHGTCPETGCTIGDECYNGGFAGGTGGAGGGGNGASNDETCTDGAANTGGGAGTGVRGEEKCSGGSGIVIIRNAVDLGVEYTYTGESELLEDGKGKWRLRLLTSGKLVFNRLTTDIDAFLVGGGGGAQNSSYPSAGGGGGGGYTQTIVVKPEIGKEYEITIGAGGTAGNNGGTTKAFGYSVLGGRTSYGGVGGNGGSGGGGHGYSGGSDGDDGFGSSTYLGGESQEYSTREFGEANGALYSGGGAGYSGSAGEGNGKANTGGGGSAYGGAGYSGIVVIRNHRDTISNVKYEYTGNSFFVDDGEGNWRIKFLSDGTFTPFEEMTIDVFLVGGGGGAQSSSYPSTGAGGGGGYTSLNTITLTPNEEYKIVIGKGGTAASSGGTTTGFTFKALGGNPGSAGIGGAGGSGGGGHAANGGSNGNSGSSNGDYRGGTGQGSGTTREFGEANGRLYSGGGAGYTGSAGSGNGKSNTGGGGSAYGGSGYSGIAVIRNAR